MKQFFSKYSWILPFIISTAFIIGLYRETYLFFNEMDLGYILPILAYGLGYTISFLFFVMFMIKRGGDYNEEKMNAIIDENKYLRSELKNKDKLIEKKTELFIEKEDSLKSTIKDKDRYISKLQYRFTKVQDELIDLETYFRQAGRINEDLIRELESYKTQEVA